MSDDKDPQAADILVPSKDPVKKDEDKPKANGDVKGKGKEEAEENDISEEDLQLKTELEMLVERLKETDTKLYIPALESLRTLIRTSTSSMTSVPKPLKFLRPHFEELGKIRDDWSADLKEEKASLALILSVLAMTYSDTGKRDTLFYRLVSGSTEAPGTWGHEYVRHLSAELGEEYNSRFVAEEETQPNGHANGVTDKEVDREYSIEQLRSLALELVEFNLQHNAEADAVDLLLELECIEEIIPKVDDKSWPRVCQYMVQCVPLLVQPDDHSFLRTAAEIYAKHDRYPEALALAVRLNDRLLVRRYYDAPTNPVMKKQLSFFLGRALVPLHWVHTAEDYEKEGEGPAPELSSEFLECLGNQKLSEIFKSFGKAVAVFEPRSVEDIYKTHLEQTRTNHNTDSARHNLASTFVNAFVNAGFGNDKLIVGAEAGESWIYKNKEQGMMSATASIGMSMLWDSEAGVDFIDKFSYSVEEHIKAGAFLAMGILHASIRPDPDVAWALLEEHIDSSSVSLKIAAMNGVAMAYAGACQKDIAERLIVHVADDTNTMDVASMAALAIGFVFVGSADGELASSILQTLMEREASALDSEWALFMVLALGLIYLGCQEESEATIETLKAIEHPIARTAEIIVDVCAHAGTGNVLKIQKMLHICGEHAVKPKKDKSDAAAPAVDVHTPPTNAVDVGDVEMTDAAPVEAAAEATDAAPNGQAVAPPSTEAASSTDSAMDGTDGDAATPTTDTPVAQNSVEAPVPPAPGQSADANDDAEDEEEEEAKPLKYQAAATIGIALIAMGEEIGSEMALRQFQHLMTYGDPVIRKSIPLALGLISASNPQLNILDTLSKYSHDSDLEVAQNAIFAMGLVGAGTNNARLAQMLRQLAVYYYTQPDCFFIVRVAQGLVHMGKGTIGINPFFQDGQIMSRPAVAGILSVIMSFTESKTFVLGKNHWMLFWLVTAMFPQFLITLDEELKEKETTVRVGQAVNTVGLAGTRMGISGFQTHQTPVRVGAGERAELGTNEYFPYSSVLEGLVILKKNEGYDAEDQ